ncbi:Deubiquitination-protection protein dph1 [Saitozyma sp. JCM 24511]|nr:Deubiquitination-protection protein dph1 [Saitozyma sp. JCM 24511]
MAEGSSQSSDEITITVKGPSELKLSITISTSKSVAELKEVIAGKSDVEKDRQRLIYSGKVLKDEDPISQYKIQNGHTIHMVKGAAKTPAAQPSASTPQPRLPQMGTGLNVAGNPVDSVENVHHGLAGFNPFAGMQGLNNLNDPNAMASMMQNPEFLRSMSEMMSRPEIIDQIISANPQLSAMGPQIRQMMANPMVRQMMSNPETLRMVMQMQSAMGGQEGMGGMGGMGGFGGMGGMGGYPGMFGAPPSGTGTDGQHNVPADPFPNLFAPQAPSAGTGGAPTTTGTGTAGATGAGATPGSPAAAGSANPPANPFAALFGNPPAGGANPFGGLDPAMLFGGGGGGFGGGGWPPAPAPRDTRPPEEIYATQLGQLNAMGLWDAQKNIRALRSTGGNVEAAIELIFSGQLDNAPQ